MELSPVSFYSAPQVFEQSRFPRWDLILHFVVVDTAGKVHLSVHYNSDLADYDDDMGFEATLPVTSFVIDQEVSAYERDWQELVELSVDESAQQSKIKQLIGDLCRNGLHLFRQIFGPDGVDQNTAQELAKLRRFLQQPKMLRILVKSTTLQVPWNLLYQGPRQGEEPWQGFLGSQHLFVQKIEDPTRRLRVVKLEPFGVRQPLNFSIQRNLTLEVHQNPPNALDSLLTRLKSYVTAIYRDNEEVFRRDLPQHVSKEDLIYFCCHGRFSPNARPYLQLTEEGQLFASDVSDLMDEAHFQYQPLIFINACFGGKIGRTFYEQFAPIFLDRGANAVIGPSVGVHAKMATNFAVSFFLELFCGSRFFPDGSAKSVPDVLFETRQRWLKQATPPDLRGLLYTIAIRERVSLPPAFNLELDNLAQAS